MKQRVETIIPGGLFIYGGVRWVKLDTTEEGGALVLAADVLFNREFDKENGNNWALSSLRGELGGGFADRLTEAGADLQAFTSFRPYLTSNDGLKRYGSTIDGIALLSCDQYRKYRDIIPQATERWWTLTPYSCGGDYAAYVCAVKVDGSIDYDAACCDDWGVRPVCVLEADTAVEMVPARAADMGRTGAGTPAGTAEEAAGNIIAVLGGMTAEEAGNALVEASKRIARMRIKASKNEWSL